MRASDLLLLLLLILAVLAWYLALQPQQLEALMRHLHPAQPTRPAVTCAHLLATMERTYDTNRYEFVCYPHWTGKVKLMIRPVR